MLNQSCSCKAGVVGTANANGLGRARGSGSGATKGQENSRALESGGGGVPGPEAAETPPELENTVTKRGSSRLSTEAKERLEALELERKCVKVLGKWDWA